MKRSEMEKLLERQLKEEHALDFLGDSPRVVAKEILHFLESKGMLPPCKYDKTEDCMFCYGEHVYIWESEDENN
jgi:hypothetical protein